MKVVVLGDEETALGFRLAGIDAVAVATPAEALAAVESAESRGDFVVIVIAPAVTDASKTISWDELESLGVRFPVVELPKLDFEGQGKSTE